MAGHRSGREVSGVFAGTWLVMWGEDSVTGDPATTQPGFRPPLFSFRYLDKPGSSAKGIGF